MYNVQNGSSPVPHVKSAHNGSESICYMGLKIWELIPFEIKQTSSMSVFANKIKNWKPGQCPCGIYKYYIDGAGI